MLIAGVVLQMPDAPTIVSVAVVVFSIVAAALLLVGLWTPISGSLVAAAALWAGVSSYLGLSTSLLLTAIGGALVMLGPGAWSVDARLYGWRRIDVRDRQKGNDLT